MPVGVCVTDRVKTVRSLPPAAFFVVLACLAIGGCGESTAPPTSSSVEIPAPPPRVGADRLRHDFAGAYAEYMAGAVAAEPLRRVLLGDADAPLPLNRARFLSHLYDSRQWLPVFVEGHQLTPIAEALLAQLRASESHGLDPSRYVSDRLAAALARHGELVQVWRSVPDVVPTSGELDALIDTLGEHDGATDPAVAALAAALDGLGVAPDLAALHAVRVSAERSVSGSAALIDAALTDAFLAYAFDQRHFNTSWVDEDLDAAGRHALIADRMTASFEEIAVASSVDDVAAIADALAPSHPTYSALLAERARYAQIVADGGWEPIEPRHLERGSRNDTVHQLSVRLALEGYWEGEPTDAFDSEFREAVEHYQRTHQMEVTGETSRGFWVSINIPADTRLAQIDLTLQRWRESRIGDDEYYVHVNVPDFHAELWRDGVRQLRFRIVVGNTDQVCDPESQTIRYANATPLQSASMTYVVLNPHWNVPHRIVEEELLVELLENPNYFVEMGFERIVNENGYEFVRQLPGPENPLGTVKFMFPNPHNTYMHDTSRPQYFRYPIRAFSHGCMRVQDPQELLRTILENDGQWDERRIEEIYEEAEEASMVLETPIPVHVEYYVVTVDDDGRANFLADIYRYDRDRLNPPSPSSLRCEQPDEEQLRLVLGEEHQVLFENEAGLRYTQQQLEYVQAGGVLEVDEEGNIIDPPEGFGDATEEGGVGIDLEQTGQAEPIEPAGDEEHAPPPAGITAGDYGP